MGPLRCTFELTLTTRELKEGVLEARNVGSKSWKKRKCPRWLVPNWVSNPSTVVPSGGFRMPIKDYRMSHWTSDNGDYQHYSPRHSVYYFSLRIPSRQPSQTLESPIPSQEAPISQSLQSRSESPPVPPGPFLYLAPAWRYELLLYVKLEQSLLRCQMRNQSQAWHC